MSVAVSETRVWTFDQAKAVVVEAIAVVTEAGVPDDLRVEAFKAAVQLVSAKRQELAAPASGLPFAVPTEFLRR